MVRVRYFYSKWGISDDFLNRDMICTYIRFLIEEAWLRTRMEGAKTLRGNTSVNFSESRFFIT